MTLAERMEIFRLLHMEKSSLKEISEKLGRAASSISREVKRGMDGSMYHPILAEAAHLEQRKNQRPQLKMTDEAWKIIKPKLELHWSPETVEKWLKSEYPEYTMCGKTIYTYINLHLKGELKKLALQDLRQRGKKRKTGSSNEKAASGRGKIPNMTLIDERQLEINAREAYGDWEGDLIIGKDHKSAICVLVERKSRFVQLDLLEKYDAETVRKTIERRFKKMNPALVRSITFDQGKENSQHQELSENTKLKVYFCHPHSPWEKGTCENTNYLVRDMIYPIDDFRELTQRDIGKVASLLNNRPRKTLDFKTPQYILSQVR
jgi:IS30 family transposase